MSAAVAKALAACALLVSFAAFGASRRLTIVFSGDNGGEIAPCG